MISRLRNDSAHGLWENHGKSYPRATREMANERPACSLLEKTTKNRMDQMAHGATMLVWLHSFDHVASLGGW